MKVPLRWLQEFIELPTTDPDELSVILAMVGHEVEGYEVIEAGWTDVVVGRVDEISAHPDADKVRVCQVDLGAGPEQIVCGAWNFSEGAHVAVARPGAVLPGDFEIGERTIRGVVSHGMICSERELGLGEDHAGILVLDGEPDLGIPFTDLLELPDVVFDLAITPNRPDAMSLVGIARDLAAHFEIEYRVPVRTVDTVPGETRITVGIEDPVGCRRFTAREIRGVTIGRSPLSVRHRLGKAGMRAISNVVDVTNYVMLELGHPLHAFDAGSIVGDQLTVRRATDGETLVTLDDVERHLTGDDLIIYDVEGPTSMSGTMGGARSEVSPVTTDVLMEAASWDPPTIMYMARRHGLRSEASTRFERGVDPSLTEAAAARAAAMVVELAGGELLEHVIDVVATPIDPVEVLLPLSEVERLLGPGPGREDEVGILERLGMEVRGSDPLSVTVPTFRPDVTRAADLIEEVARIYGYDRFPATVPMGAGGGLTPEQGRRRKLDAALVGIGLSQAVTLPFVSEDQLAAMGGVADGGLLQVTNPLREEESILRPAMLPGLLEVARFNISHGAASVAVFESALVFGNSRSGEDVLPDQTARLAWVLVGHFGPSDLGTPVRSADGEVSLAVARHVMATMGHTGYSLDPAPADGFHPGRSAALTLNGEVIGHVGELSPRAARAFALPGRVGIAELDLDPVIAPVELIQAVSPSVFPHVEFDLSFVVPGGLAVGSLVDVTTGAGSGLVEWSRVFDVFRGPGVGDGNIAVAIRYRLRAQDRTLSNEEVAPVRQAMVAAAEAVGARLRGA